VQEFNGEGKFERQFGQEGSGPGQLFFPDGLAVDPSGNVWVADGGNARVEEFDSAGNYKTQFGSRGSGQGQLMHPSGLAIGANAAIWVTDDGGDQVEKWMPGT
jgi:DNA-binding beta-propeller fold protein YncE